MVGVRPLLQTVRAPVPEPEDDVCIDQVESDCVVGIGMSDQRQQKADEQHTAQEMFPASEPECPAIPSALIEHANTSKGRQ